MPSPPEPPKYKAGEKIEVPFGHCQCGCGAKTDLASQTRRNYVKGQPLRFRPGHATRKPIRYVSEDRGYQTPCWIWQLHLAGNGYGMMTVDGCPRAVHRIHFEQANGPIPPDLQLDHLCRVRECVNPDHLEPVTSAVNTQRGSIAKLDPDKVREIRSSSAPYTELMERYGVGATAIWNVRHGKTWKDVHAANPSTPTEES